MIRRHGINVLETADIQRRCPSFYATGPKGDVSGRYEFINTRDVALGLWKQGWMPTWAEETKSHAQSGNRGLNRHMVRWAHPDAIMPNGDRVEIVGVNSHNRTAPMKLMVGVFVMVCSNGCITMSNEFGSYTFKHIGRDMLYQLDDALSQIGPVAKKIPSKIVEFSDIKLDEEEALILAETAHGYVYDKPSEAPIRAHQLLETHRPAYRGRNDLWARYNVIQENIIRGGVRGRNRRGGRMRTQRIRSLDKNARLNQALWEMTERMAECKLN